MAKRLVCAPWRLPKRWLSYSKYLCTHLTVAKIRHILSRSLGIAVLVEYLTASISISMPAHAWKSESSLHFIWIPMCISSESFCLLLRSIAEALPTALKQTLTITSVSMCYRQYSLIKYQLIHWPITNSYRLQNTASSSVFVIFYWPNRLFKNAVSACVPPSVTIVPFCVFSFFSFEILSFCIP